MTVADPLLRTFGWLLFATGSALLVWAVFGDAMRRRFRKRRRCPKCWYDLSHTTGLRCNECGHEARREKHLFRARRRWSMMIIGCVAALVGVSVDGAVKSKAHGWAAAVPTTGIILALPWLTPDATALDPFAAKPTGVSSVLVHDLGLRRIPDGDLWNWQISMLLGRARRGDAKHPPLSPEWGTLYGSILREIGMNGYVEKSDALIAKWASIAQPVLETRNTWPANHDVWAYAFVKRWAADVWYGLDATTMAHGFDDFSIRPVETTNALHRYGYSTRWMDYRVRLGPSSDTGGDQSVTYNCDIVRGPLWTLEREADRDMIEVGRESFDVSWEVAPRIESIVRPVRSDEVQRSLSKDDVISVEWCNDELLLYLPLRLIKPHSTWMDEHQAAIAVRIEIRHHGEVKARGEAWWGMAPTIAASIAQTGTTVLIPRGELIPLASEHTRQIRDALLDENAASTGDWTVHLIADPVIALRHFSAKAYWNGEGSARLRGM